MGNIYSILVFQNSDSLVLVVVKRTLYKLINNVFFVYECAQIYWRWQYGNVRKPHSEYYAEYIRHKKYFKIKSNELCGVL